LKKDYTIQVSIHQMNKRSTNVKVLREKFNIYGIFIAPLFFS